MECQNVNEVLFDFIHFWSVTLVNTIKTTSFTPPSVIKLYLLFVYVIKLYLLFVYVITLGGVNEVVLIEMLFYLKWC
jgi:hypothetical protein